MSQRGTQGRKVKRSMEKRSTQERQHVYGCPRLTAEGPSLSNRPHERETCLVIKTHTEN